MENEGKLRLLYLNKLLHELTDEEHPLSTRQLMDLLHEKYALQAHRMTVASDIQVLQDFGVDIYKIESTQNKYFVASRDFDLPELKLLIDAVESSKFITEKKSGELVKKLSCLASRNQAAALKRNLCAEGRVKQGNEKIYYIMDAVNEAINQGKKISFKYFQYDARKNRQLRHGGQVYVFSPYTLVWNGDHYYTVGYSDKHGEIACFRVDRIAEIPAVLEEVAVPQPKDFDISVFLRTVFNMYNSPCSQVELRCEGSMMDAVIDRFGEDVPTRVHEDGSFTARVRVAVTPVFFGWVFGFGGKISIQSPPEAREKYRELVRRAAQDL